MRLVTAIILFFSFHFLHAEIPQVPAHMELGNMKLRISSGAQEIIQGHVNEIYKNESYLKKMVEKAHLYFPMIDKIFHEEGVPKEFRYLCIQESGFKADAVSSSNAVGFWQFKDFTAREVGLFVERDADERKHIVYATKGAAKYLKKNYFYLKNWIYTCQSYQQGLGGTQRSVDQSLFGADKMNIDKNTYWYVMKFLAHIVAYEHAVKKHYKQESLELNPVLAGKNTRLKELAGQYAVTTEDLELHNPWLRGDRIPDYRDEYYVLVPGKVPSSELVTEVKETITIDMKESDPVEIDRIASRQTVNPSVRIIIKVNQRKAILANSGDSPVTLALRGGITKDRLLNYNDMIPGEEIEENMIYFLQPKRNRNKISRHVAKGDESLWEISQKYGIKEKALRRKNRMNFGEEPKPGRILYLNRKMSKNSGPEYIELENLKSDEQKPNDSAKTENKTVAQPVSETEQPKLSEQPEEALQKADENTEMDEADQEIQTETVVKPVQEENETGQFFMHSVSAGETLYSISKKYNVKVEDIVEWNELKSLSLSIGQKIRIKEN